MKTSDKILNFLGMAALLVAVGYAKSYFFTKPEVTPNLNNSIYSELERMNTYQKFPDLTFLKKSSFPPVPQPTMKELLEEQARLRLQRNNGATLTPPPE